MPIPEIEEFAKILVEHVRDAAIRSSDNHLRPTGRGPIAARWRAAGIQEGVGHAMISDCVDETVFHLLRAIDQGLLPIAFVSSNGRAVDLARDGLGELAGWYMGSGGWRASYSGERFIDDFKDPGQSG